MKGAADLAGTTADLSLAGTSRRVAPRHDSAGASNGGKGGASKPAHGGGGFIGLLDIFGTECFEVTNPHPNPNPFNPNPNPNPIASR